MPEDHAQPQDSASPDIDLSSPVSGRDASAQVEHIGEHKRGASEVLFLQEAKRARVDATSEEAQSCTGASSISTDEARTDALATTQIACSSAEPGETSFDLRHEVLPASLPVTDSEVMPSVAEVALGEQEVSRSATDDDDASPLVNQTEPEEEEKPPSQDSENVPPRANEPMESKEERALRETKEKRAAALAWLLETQQRKKQSLVA
jgi:hypothetical protein